MTGNVWIDVLAVIAAVGAALGALHRFVLRPVARVFIHLSEFLEDWRGRPDRPGFKGHPGAMVRLAQLENNGGSSIKDTVENTASAIADLTRQFGRHLQDVEEDKRAGKRVEKELREAIGNLAEALPLAVRATPSGPDREGEG